MNRMYAGLALFFGGLGLVGLHSTQALTSNVWRVIGLVCALIGAIVVFWYFRSVGDEGGTSTDLGGSLSDGDGGGGED